MHFFKNMFGPYLVESTDAQTVDMDSSPWPGRKENGVESTEDHPKWAKTIKCW